MATRQVYEGDRRVGHVPPHRKTARNREVVAGIAAGMSRRELAASYGVSVQRVTQIWQQYGDGQRIEVVERLKERPAWDDPEVR